MIAVSCWDQADECPYTYRSVRGSISRSTLGNYGPLRRHRQGQGQGTGYEALPGEAWIEQDVDILIPAAMENQITGENVSPSALEFESLLKARTVRRHPKPTLRFRERGILVIPDFLANTPAA